MIKNVELQTGLKFPGWHKAMSKMRVKQGMPPLPAVTIKDGADPIVARVNHSRWIADCPHCSGAEFVPIDDPKFMCQSCWNDGTGEYIPVTMPRVRVAIEKLLNMRPRIETRNWQGESLHKLAAENLEMGIE